MSKGFASNYRIVLLAVAVIAAFGGLGVRLVFLHVIDRDELVRVIEKARRQIIAENARRGDILSSRWSLRPGADADRLNDNNILATSRSLILLQVDPQVLRKQDEPKWPELARLTGIPLAELTRVFNTKTRPIPPDENAFSIGTGASVKLPGTAAADSDAQAEDGDPDEPANALAQAVDANGERPIRWAKLSESISESTYTQIEALGIKGVYGTRVYRRAYPHKSLAAHIVGYVNKAGEPAAGVERYADFYLHGRDGWREGERDGKGREIAQFRTREVPAADGFSVVLSLDTTVQHIVEEEVEQLAKTYHPEKITIIVSDPRTGFIKAMANYPNFDLNEYNKVPKSEESSMKNVAVTDQYEPGSTFKIVAASAALNDGLVNPATSFDCSLERIDYLGRSRGLPKEDHHFGMLSVAEIIAHSSNRGAAQLAMLMGADRFYKYARAFGFGEKSGFPIGGEIDGEMAAPKDWDLLTITRMPMGHSVAATPLQMHMAMGVIASGGYLLQPQIIHQIRDASGEVVYRYDTIVKRSVISEKTAELMARMLMGVASEEGTAPKAAIPNYEVAGKTGTTQKIINKVYSTKHHIASFVGFFPASSPKVAISVIVDDADAYAPNGVAYGSAIAAPAFRRIGEQLIQYLDIKPVYSNASAGANNVVMGGVRR